MKNTLVHTIGVVTGLLLAAAALALPAAQAQERAVSPRVASVTLKASAPRVDAGKRLVLTGTVRNRPAGTTVVLQRLFKVDGVWKTVERLRVGKAGGVRYVDRVHRAGERRYRLVVPKRGARPRAVSTSVPVTVWEWHDLNDYTAARQYATFQRQRGVRVDDDGILIEGDAILGDSAVDHGFMTWNTRGTCTDAVATLQGTSGPLGFGNVAFTVDGVVVREADVEGSTGDRLLVRQAISGAHEIGFEWRKIDDDFEAVMSEARVYCPF